MTKRRMVVKKGKSRRVKKVARRSRRIRGGNEKEQKALDFLRKLRIEGIQAKINEQEEIIKGVGETYAKSYRMSSPPKQESDRLDSERTNAENTILKLRDKLDELQNN